MTIDISQETATPPAIPVTKQPADVADDSSSTASFASLKDRIKSHYDICSDYYLSLWGQHIHHGYWTPETDNLTKEIAQVHLIELLLSRAGYPCNPEYAQQLGLPSHLQPASKSTNEQPRKLRVLDVGCGVGGTTRYLAEQRGWDVTGVTISSEQIKIAYELTDKLVSSTNGSSTTQTAATGQNRSGEKISVGKGSVQYIQLDAEKMGDHFPHGTFDIVWISEALSHLPNKDLFFRSSSLLLKDQNDNNSTEKEKGKLVIADWLKAPNLTQKQFDEDIEPIEVGMLLPPLDTMDGYLNKAEQNGLRVRQGGEAMDISANVKRTWDISLSLIQSPSLWAFAFSQGRDVVAFLRAFQAMRRGFGNGNFRYGVVVFEKEG